MALGYNRKYNSTRGLNVKGAQLTPNAPLRGTIALYGGRPVVIETVPKTGPGLPSGDQAEEYVIDGSACVWNLRVWANGAAVDAGDRLQNVITAIDPAQYNGPARVGDLTQVNTGETGITFGDIQGSVPILKRLLSGTQITADAVADCEVVMPGI